MDNVIRVSHQNLRHLKTTPKFAMFKYILIIWGVTTLGNQTQAQIFKTS